MPRPLRNWKSLPYDSLLDVRALVVPAVNILDVANWQRWIFVSGINYEKAGNLTLSFANNLASQSVEKSSKAMVESSHLLLYDIHANNQCYPYV